MHIKRLCIKNFRRLKDVEIDLDPEISILVGANNSGKTSVLHAIQLFTEGRVDGFSMNEFSVESWPAFEAFGNEVEHTILPKISLDIWFHVEQQDLHRVFELLPSLDWEGNEVGIRVELAARDETELLSNFSEARRKAEENSRPETPDRKGYHPSPRTLIEYLSDNHSAKLKREFELRHFILDGNSISDEDYKPTPIARQQGRINILKSLVRVDFLHAQRHLSDSQGRERSQDLSTRLSDFYKRNLDKVEDDHDAIRALSDSASNLNEHLERVFDDLLKKLEFLGYPGVTNSKLLIKTALNPSAVMGGQGGARVHYSLADTKDEVNAPLLPDHYNGLGYKNLIYMVVELLDLHAQWKDADEHRPPLHLVFIEEPEAHLHAQLQQVFIRQILEILDIEENESDFFSNQMVVTTHSAHILYERGFSPIRYFRRCLTGKQQFSQVLNLSRFYRETDEKVRDFLERYLKLSHCDLFFADAAVLVEGNVERLLLPQMIKKSAAPLESVCICILEIGGAFGYRFRSLVEFLGITCLIITDIDSVTPLTNSTDEDSDGSSSTSGKSCMTNVAGAITSNQTLIQWIPKKRTIAELLEAELDARLQKRSNVGDPLINVVYQCEIDVSWKGESKRIAGRTLEEAFAFENLEWCQNTLRSDLNLVIPRSDELQLEELTEKIHKRVKSPHFKKTDFALALLAEKQEEWRVPKYIDEGLKWLEQEVAMNPVPATDPTLGTDPVLSTGSVPSAAPVSDLETPS